MSSSLDSDAAFFDEVDIEAVGRTVTVASACLSCDTINHFLSAENDSITLRAPRSCIPRRVNIFSNKSSTSWSDGRTVESGRPSSGRVLVDEAPPNDDSE